MGQYSKPAMVLLCEQIQRDNPELDIELNAETLMLLSGPLTAGEPRARISAIRRYRGTLL